MAISLEHPYNELDGIWTRGSFHGHCSENSRCSGTALADSVSWYNELGVGFITLTDHDHVTVLSKMRKTYPAMTFLEGFEYSSRENVLFAGPTVPPLYQLSLEEALDRAADLLTVVCHPRPNADGIDYWTREMLEELGVWPDGIEVFNGHYGTPSATKHGRCPLYSEFWDELLTAGHRLWGYANDDFHDKEDFANAFNMVHVDQVSPESVTRAAKAGRCYASTGLLLSSIEERGGKIVVKTASDCEGVFVGPGGTRLSAGAGRQFEYTAHSEDYIRFEAQGGAGRLFLQPMWSV